MAKPKYTRLEDYEGRREAIAAVQDPTRDHLTKVDPVSGKTVTDRAAEDARVDDLVDKAQRYVERVGEDTPKIPSEGQAEIGYRSDEETDEAFLSDEYDRAKAYEQGRVDPIEGLVALEESDDPLLQTHGAKAMRDAQGKP